MARYLLPLTDICIHFFHGSYIHRIHDGISGTFQWPLEIIALLMDLTSVGLYSWYDFQYLPLIFGCNWFSHGSCIPRVVLTSKFLVPPTDFCRSSFLPCILCPLSCIQCKIFGTSHWLLSNRSSNGCYFQYPTNLWRSSFPHGSSSSELYSRQNFWHLPLTFGSIRSSNRFYIPRIIHMVGFPIPLTDLGIAISQ